LIYAHSSARDSIAADAGGWTSRPARADVLRSLRWAALLAILFFSVYGFCNWAAAARPDRWRLWFDWELGIPLVPWMVWPYLSLVASFFMPMFALRGHALDALCRRLAAAVIISGVAFLILPAEAGFVRPAEAPNAALAIIYALDLPHNLAPSLHISWGAIILLSLRGVSSATVGHLFEIWFVVLCAAVLLTHQHHVVDVAGGILVAYVAWHVVRRDGTWALTLTGGKSP
jgi:hypothetical protein